MQKVLHISQQNDRQADRELDKRQIMKLYGATTSLGSKKKTALRPWVPLHLNKTLKLSCPILNKTAS